MFWLRRAARILLAYGIASLASGTVVAVVVTPFSDGLGRVIQLAFTVSAMIALVASLPALVAILVGELRPIRHLVYYCLVAVALGVGLPILLGIHRWEKHLPRTGACIGPVAGWLYWLIAGRRAVGKRS